MKLGKNSKSGFTLVEIMVVVALIAVLASIAIPNFIAYRKTAHSKACLDNMHLIRSACRATEIKSGVLETDLTRLYSDGKGFLKFLPKCPVGGTYKITIDPQTEAVEVSCSQNGQDEHNVSETDE